MADRRLPPSLKLPPSPRLWRTGWRDKQHGTGTSSAFVKTTADKAGNTIFLEFHLRPSPFKRGGDGVRGQSFPQWCWCALIEENFPARPLAGYATVKLCSAYFRTDSTCSRRTPWNHSRKSSTVAPPSRFSNSAATGTRVPLKSQAPLTFPGTRSTAAQLLQSSMTSRYLCFPKRARIESVPLSPGSGAQRRRPYGWAKSETAI